MLAILKNNQDLRFLLSLLWLCYNHLTIILCTCGYPGRPANGKLLRSDRIHGPYSVGDVVNFACEKGHYLRGRASRICMPDGKWSGTLPICDSTLTNFKEAFSLSSLKLYPASLAIDGDTRTCFYSGRSKPREWTLDMMTIRKVYSVVITVPFASSEHYFSIYVSGDNNSITEWIRCSSFTGIFATKTQQIPCGLHGIEGRFLHIKDNSKQAEYFGLCEVKVIVEKEKYHCGEPEQPLHSIRIETDEEKEAIFRCAEGFQLVGSEKRTCRSDGLWLGEQAQCKEIACRSLKALANGRMTIKGSSLARPIQQSEIVFTCNTGYTLTGESTTRCLSTGQWTNEPPICKVLDCGLPPNTRTDGGKFVLVNGSTSYHSIAQLECSNGLKPIGSNTVIICQEDGQWSSYYATCDQHIWLASNDFQIHNQPQSVLKAQPNSQPIFMLITLVGILISIVLLASILLKRKILSVKLIPWREEEMNNGNNSVAPASASWLQNFSKKLGLNRADKLTKELAVNSPIVGSLKISPSFASLPLPSSSPLSSSPSLSTSQLPSPHPHSLSPPSCSFSIDEESPNSSALTFTKVSTPANTATYRSAPLSSIIPSPSSGSGSTSIVTSNVHRIQQQPTLESQHTRHQLLRSARISTVRSSKRPQLVASTSSAPRFSSPSSSDRSVTLSQSNLPVQRPLADDTDSGKRSSCSISIET